MELHILKYVIISNDLPLQVHFTTVYTSLKEHG